LIAYTGLHWSDSYQQVSDKFSMNKATPEIVYQQDAPDDQNCQSTKSTALSKCSIIHYNLSDTSTE